MRAQRVFNKYLLEDQAFSLSYDLAPANLHPPYPFSKLAAVHKIKGPRAVLEPAVLPSCEPQSMKENSCFSCCPPMSSLLVFDRVYGLEIQSVMLVFLTPLVN